MKRHLPFFLLAFVLFFVNVLHAQPTQNTCFVSRVGLQVTNRVANNDGTCTVTANVFFVTEKRNQGAKYFNIHLWNRTDRPTDLNLSQPFTAAQLNLTLRDIVLFAGQGNKNEWNFSRTYNKVNNNPAINNDGVSLKFYEVPDDVNNPVLQTQFKNYTFFILSNVVFTTKSACDNLDLVADVTGGQDNNNQNILGCDNTGQQVFECQTAAEDFSPIITANLQCGTGTPSYTLSFDNQGGCLPAYFTYAVYADLNSSGSVDAGDQLVSEGPANDYQVLLPGELKFKGPRTLTGAAAEANLIVTDIVAYVATLDGVIEERPEDISVTNGCIALPVSFKSFTAARNQQAQSQVDLTWETAMEQNNKGFHVQRKTDGEWQTIAFVFSAAEGGNSTQTQRYTYKDNNNFRGVSQYRLLQEDLDGTAAYSDVKTVRGLEQAATVVVYPNPAVNGKTSILFPDATTQRNVVISDLSGRAVRQYRNLTDNTLVVDGLATGFYTVRVTDGKSGAVQVIKLVVQ